jgi:hypothetical protein
MKKHACAAARSRNAFANRNLLWAIALCVLTLALWAALRHSASRQTDRSDRSDRSDPSENAPPAAPEPPSADPVAERPPANNPQARLTEDMMALVPPEAPANAYRRSRLDFVVQEAGLATAQTVYVKHTANARERRFALDGILHDLNKAIVARYTEQAQKERGDRPDILVRPGLIADRTARTVVMYAQATGLGGKGDPPEFFIVSEKSGHDYEALSIAFCRPGDLHRAMEFIGMAPGHPVRHDRFQFWPKGERAFFTFRALTGDTPAADPIPMEELFLARAGGPTLERSGLVFTGSLTLPDPADPQRTVYAADAFDPRAIAAAYNEPTAVFDVPRQAPQAEVYGRIGVNPVHLFAPLALLEIVIKPELEKGRQRVWELDMLVATAADGPQVVVTVKDAQGAVLHERAAFEQVLEDAAKQVAAGRDPFVTVRFDPAMRLSAIPPVSALLASVDTGKGLRIEAPPPGQLYYRAFTPDPAFRDRRRHYVHPLELRLLRTNGGLRGELTRVQTVWKDRAAAEPQLQTQTYPVADGAALRARLDEIEAGLDVILVFAPLDLTLGDLMRFIEPARSTHPVIHVYAEPTTK